MSLTRKTAVEVLDYVEKRVGQAEEAHDQTDTKLGEAEDFLEVYKAVFEDEEMAKYSDGELAVNLFRVSDIFYRFIALKSKIKPDERSGWVRFWTGHRSVEYIIDASHPAFKRLKDIIWRLRGKADQRLKNLNPTVEVLQGITFQWRTAAVLAQLSLLVYKISDWRSEETQKATQKATQEECKKWIADADLSVKYFHSDGVDVDNAALVVISSASIYLVFRGTVSRTNWRQNFNLTRKEFESSGLAGKVHGGFFAAQDSLWGALSTHISPFLGSRNVYIGGHSLGGAMAIITAARLASDSRIKRLGGVYTFGSPALFDPEAASRYDEHPRLKGRTFRVEYNGDYVAKSLAWLRFFHPGTSIRLTERDGMTAKARSEYEVYYGDILLDPAKFLVTGAKAHGMDMSYLKTIHWMAYRADPCARLPTRAGVVLTPYLL